MERLESKATNGKKPVDNAPIIEANAREVHVIEFLAGLDAQLVQGQDFLRERLKLIPNGWRDFRLAAKSTERVLDAVYNTLPNKTLVHMQNLAKYGQIVIRPKPTVRMHDDMQIVCADDLKLLINAAIASECLMCVKDAREQKKCKLRKTLMNIAPTAAVHKDGLCAYIDVVAGNEFGEYI